MKKKKQITGIQLAFPCTQRWEDMTVCDKGRFCSGCQKTVFDFTDKTQDFFNHILRQNNEQVCGRFSLNQLKTQHNLQKAALIAGVLLTTEMNAQNNPLPQSSLSSHTDSIRQNEKEAVFIGIIVEPQAEFRGGMRVLYKFITDNMTYPHGQECVQGTVYVSFVVNTDGSLKDFKIKKGFKNLPTYNEEALRVVKLTSGQWIPAKRQGQPLETIFTIPIKFVL